MCLFGQHDKSVGQSTCRWPQHIFHYMIYLRPLFAHSRVVVEQEKGPTKLQLPPGSLVGVTHILFSGGRKSPLRIIHSHNVTHVFGMRLGDAHAVHPDVHSVLSIFIDDAKIFVLGRYVRVRRDCASGPCTSIKFVVHSWKNMSDKWLANCQYIHKTAICTVRNSRSDTLKIIMLWSVGVSCANR